MFIFSIEKYLEEFPILKVLPKKCHCTSCSATKSNIKKQVGEKIYLKICQTLNMF